MRTTIRMNAELARRAKARASKTGKSFTQAVEEAVSEWLAKPAARPRRRKFSFPIVGDPNQRISTEQYRAAIEEIHRDDATRVRRAGGGK